MYIVLHFDKYKYKLFEYKFDIFYLIIFYLYLIIAYYHLYIRTKINLYFLED